MTLALTINGQDTEVEAPNGMPLLWVLRELLGLTGTRLGCGAGLCGACTVHVDGEAVQEGVGIETLARRVAEKESA